ncbi:hypothetical protein PCK1_001130 [Pneumocystis canis]|nr:hypothetical protein PCK1_001130 [Pneumocystis canis]
MLKLNSIEGYREENEGLNIQKQELERFRDENKRFGSLGSLMKKKYGKKVEGVLNNIKCEQCGKGYKHIGCLEKHRWEHTIYFNPKLSISKHQQVQLLEAASILVRMNQSKMFKMIPLDVWLQNETLINELNDSNTNFACMCIRCVGGGKCEFNEMRE